MASDDYRTIDNSDLWAAIRGLGMYRMTRSDLRDIVRRHQGNAMFASRTILEAARQVLATKRERGATKSSASGF